MNKFKYLFIFPLLLFTFFLTRNVYAVGGSSEMFISFYYNTDQQIWYNYTLGSWQQFGTSNVPDYRLQRYGLAFNNVTPNDSSATYYARLNFQIASDDFYNTGSFPLSNIACTQFSGGISNATSNLVSYSWHNANEDSINKPFFEVTCDYSYRSSTAFYQVFENNNLVNVMNFPITPSNTYFKVNVVSWTSSNDNSQVVISQNNTMITQNDTIINQNSEIIQQQEQINSSIEDLNDTFENTNTTENDITSQFGQIQDVSDTPISDLLTLPLVLLNKLYNSLSDSCSPYSIPFDFSGGNNTLTFQCINLGNEKYLGRIVWGYIDDLFCIFMIYNIGKLIIWFFNGFTTLTDNFEYVMDPNANTKGLF